MKRYIFLLISLCTALCMFAGQEELILIKIGSREVTRSEFEYMYRKHCLDFKNDQESLDKYLDLFINLKLKVVEAESCGYDTLQSFKDNLLEFCDRLNGDDKNITENIYEPSGNEVRVAHIFIYLPQDASDKQIATTTALMDSIYTSLLHGADFDKLAKMYSDDKETADKGGILPWLTINRKVKEFESNAFSDLPIGSYIAPFSTPGGLHILKLLGRRPNREQQNLEIDNLTFPIQEYRDAILSAKIDDKILLNRSKDLTLEDFFKENKSDYKWDVPRFNGIIFYTKDKKQIKEIKKLLKKIPREKWASKLKEVKAENKRYDIIFSDMLFAEGDDANVDRVIFKKGELQPKAGYPYMGTLGKKVKRPETYKDIFDLVVSDYKKYLERSWISDLKAKYKVEINQEVLKTVNNH